MLSPYVSELFEMLGIEKEAYLKLMEEMPRTFRVNTLKISLPSFHSFAEFTYSPSPLPFAFEVPKDFPIGRTLSFSIGYIHTQTLSSMLPPLALNPAPHSLTIDVAAAPGGKTTQMAELMANTGLLIANDKKKERLSPLVGNINRLGVLNAAVVSLDGRKLPWRNTFDYALVDAPCSNLGSSLRALGFMNRRKVKSLVRVQKKMLLSAFDSLKPNGILIYSTCTITEEENEGVVNFLLNERESAKLEPIKLTYKGKEIEIPHDNGLSDYGREFKKVWRIYPKHINSEAFFIAKIRKG